MYKPFITGTQAFGPVTDNSDIDIVVHIDDAPDFEKFLLKKGFDTYKSKSQQAGNYPGFYFDFFVMKINIIVLGTDDFISWQDRTAKMRKNCPDVEDRETRIKLFDALGV